MAVCLFVCLLHEAKKKKLFFGESIFAPYQHVFTSTKSCGCVVVSAMRQLCRLLLTIACMNVVLAHEKTKRKEKKIRYTYRRIELNHVALLSENVLHRLDQRHGFPQLQPLLPPVRANKRSAVILLKPPPAPPPPLLLP